MNIYNILSGINGIFGIICCSYMLVRCWESRNNHMSLVLYFLVAFAAGWLATVYLLSFFQFAFFPSVTLTMGAWVRPIMPIMLTGPVLIDLRNKP